MDVGVLGMDVAVSAPGICTAHVCGCGSARVRVPPHV